jgi:hypothetical protein
MFGISSGVGCEAARKAETSRLPTTGWVCDLTIVVNGYK